MEAVHNPMVSVGICLTIVSIVTGILYWVIRGGDKANDRKAEGVASVLEQNCKLFDTKLKDCQKMRDETQENIDRRMTNIESDLKEVKKISQENHTHIAVVEAILSERFPKAAKEAREKVNNGEY